MYAMHNQPENLREECLGFGINSSFLGCLNLFGTFDKASFDMKYIQLSEPIYQKRKLSGYRY